MNGEIIYNIPEYTGAGVYALTDDYGIQYVGSSLNIEQRIKQHDRCLALAKNRDSKEISASSKMKISVKNGVHFKASILWKLPDGGTQYDLWDAEKEFLLAAGGCEKTYNTKDVPDYRENDLSGLCGWRSCEPSKRRDEAIFVV